MDEDTRELIETKLELAKQAILGQARNDMHEMENRLETELVQKIKDEVDSSITRKITVKVPDSIKWVAGIIMGLFVTFISISVASNAALSEKLTAVRINVNSLNEKIVKYDRYEKHIRRLYRMLNVRYIVKTNKGKTN